MNEQCRILSVLKAPVSNNLMVFVFSCIECSKSSNKEVGPTFTNEHVV